MILKRWQKGQTFVRKVHNWWYFLKIAAYYALVEKNNSTRCLLKTKWLIKRHLVKVSNWIKRRLFLKQPIDVCSFFFVKILDQETFINLPISTIFAFFFKMWHISLKGIQDKNSAAYFYWIFFHYFCSWLSG